MSQLGADRFHAANRWLRLAAGVALGLLLAGNAFADEVYAPAAAITLPNNQVLTAFDISFDDAVLEAYFLADRTNAVVEVVDTRTNTLSAQLKGPFKGATGNNNTSGPDGVITVNHQEVWAGDGDSTVKVIDLLSQQTTHVISTNGTMRADELCWDPRDHLVLVANDADSPPFVSFISTDTYTVVGKIAMNGSNGTPNATNGIEQCQWSFRTGMFYLNIPEVNGTGNDMQPGAVLVISPETMSITKTFSIPNPPCAGPQGMAIGPENQILLGCNDPNGTVPSTVIINEHSGAVMHVLAGEDGSDEVTYNHEGHYFLPLRWRHTAAIGSGRRSEWSHRPKPGGRTAEHQDIAARGEPFGCRRSDYEPGVRPNRQHLGRNHLQFGWRC